MAALFQNKSPTLPTNNTETRENNNNNKLLINIVIFDIQLQLQFYEKQ